MLPCNSNSKSDRKQITLSANAEGYRLASITALLRRKLSRAAAAPSNNTSKAAGQTPPLNFPSLPHLGFHATLGLNHLLQKSVRFEKTKWCPCATNLSVLTPQSNFERKMIRMMVRIIPKDFASKLKMYIAFLSKSSRLQSSPSFKIAKILRATLQAWLKGISISRNGFYFSVAFSSVKTFY